MIPGPTQTRARYQVEPGGPVCDFFEVDFKYQVEVVRRDAILSSMVEKNSNEKAFGDKRDRILLPKSF